MYVLKMTKIMIHTLHGNMEGTAMTRVICCIRCDILNGVDTHVECRSRRLTLCEFGTDVTVHVVVDQDRRPRDYFTCLEFLGIFRER